MVKALLLYTLFVGFIPSKADLNFKHADNRQQLFFYEKIYFSSMDLLYKQTNNNAKPSIGYGKHLLATTLIYPSLYKQIRKNGQWTNALIITICLILSEDIHPGPHPVTPEERPLEERDTIVLQVRPLYDALQCSPVHSNLSCPPSLLGAAAVGTLGSRAGAVTELVDWRMRCARVSRAGVGVGGVLGAHGVGVGGVRHVLGGSRGGRVCRAMASRGHWVDSVFRRGLGCMLGWLDPGVL